MEDDEEFEEIIEEVEEDEDYLDIAVPSGRNPSRDDFSRLTPDNDSGDDDIVEEVVEDSYEEVEVDMDEFEEEEVANSDDESYPPPADVMASFTGTAPEMGDFVFPQSDDEYVPKAVSDEEMSETEIEYVEEEIKRVSAEGISESAIEYAIEEREEEEIFEESVEEIVMDVSESNRRNANGSSEDVGEEEEKRETGEAGTFQAVDTIQEENESIPDFSPCLDITSDNEDELTERLYGALHHALDAWDLHQFDMVAPRPGQEKQSAADELDKKEKSEASAPTSSDLYWAAQKAIDTIYPDMYCVPPLPNPLVPVEESKENNEITSVSKASEDEKQEESVQDNLHTMEKEDPAVDTDASTSASTNTEVSGTSSSAALSSRPLFWAVRDSLEAIFPTDSQYTAPISVVENDEVDSHGIANPHLPANAEIFSLRLRRYQEERRRHQMSSSLRVPQGDDINVPYDGAIKSPLPRGQRDRSRPVKDDEPGKQQGDYKNSARTQARFDKGETESLISEVLGPKNAAPFPGRKSRTRLDPPGRNGRKHSTANPPDFDWDDEEARFIPRTEKPAVLYNTDPAKYDRNKVVFERELIIVPKKEENEYTDTAETARTVIRTILLACLLVVPVTVGAFFALRKKDE